MTRRVLPGGQVLDSTGAPAAAADVAVQDGRVVDVGTGPDGDESVDCTGTTLLPGLFDCHVHVMMSGVDTLRQLQTPFSYGFYEAARDLRRTLALGITSERDAGGADLGVVQADRDGLTAGPRRQIAISMLSQTGGHGDGWHVCGAETPLFPAHPRRPATSAVRLLGVGEELGTLEGAIAPTTSPSPATRPTCRVRPAGSARCGATACWSPGTGGRASARCPPATSCRRPTGCGPRGPRRRAARPR